MTSQDEQSEQPVTDDEFYQAVLDKFGLLLTDYGFQLESKSNEHLSRFVVFRSEKVKVTVIHERYMQVDMAFERLPTRPCISSLAKST